MLPPLPEPLSRACPLFNITFHCANTSLFGSEETFKFSFTNASPAVLELLAVNRAEPPFQPKTLASHYEAAFSVKIEEIQKPFEAPAVPELPRLPALLRKVFHTAPLTPEELAALDGPELATLLLVLLKKYKTPMPQGWLTHAPERLAELANAAVAKDFSKTADENFKYVFPRVLKALMRAIPSGGAETQHSIKSLKHAFEGKYFPDCGELKKLTGGRSVLCFLKNECKDVSGTSVRRLISILFASKLFSADFFHYLEVHLMNACMDQAVKNMDKLLEKWGRMIGSLAGMSRDSLEKGKQKEGLVEKLKNQITKNKRCSIPWTKKEVLSAISFTKELISLNKT